MRKGQGEVRPSGGPAGGFSIWRETLVKKGLTAAGLPAIASSRAAWRRVQDGGQTQLRLFCPVTGVDGGVAQRILIAVVHRHPFRIDTPRPHQAAAQIPAESRAAGQWEAKP